jgi:DNA-directed RNA polymerase alpha subunit
LGSNIGQLVEQKEAILFNVLNKNKSSLCGIKTKIKDFGHKSIILYTPK